MYFLFLHISFQSFSSSRQKGYSGFPLSHWSKRCFTRDFGSAESTHIEGCLTLNLLISCGRSWLFIVQVYKFWQKCWIWNSNEYIFFFSPQASWTNASKKQREKLLELIRRLAEDDKDGVMAHKVLNLLWNLAHSDDVPVDIMDQALSAHIKILDYSCSQVNVYTWGCLELDSLNMRRSVFACLSLTQGVRVTVKTALLGNSCRKKLCGKSR